MYRVHSFQWQIIRSNWPHDASNFQCHQSYFQVIIFHVTYWHLIKFKWIKILIENILIIKTISIDSDNSILNFLKPLRLLQCNSVVTNEWNFSTQLRSTSTLMYCDMFSCMRPCLKTYSNVNQRVLQIPMRMAWSGNLEIIFNFFFLFTR